MDCPKCGGNVYCKDGIVQGRQRYLCKGCRYRYTVEQRSGTGGKALGIGALPGGTGLQIDRSYFVVSNVPMLNWVKAFGEALPKIKRDEPVQVMEIDNIMA